MSTMEGVLPSEATPLERVDSWIPQSTWQGGGGMAGRGRGIHSAVSCLLSLCFSPRPPCPTLALGLAVGSTDIWPVR